MSALVAVGDTIGGWVLLEDLGVRYSRSGESQRNFRCRHVCNNPSERTFRVTELQVRPPKRCRGCYGAHLAAQQAAFASQGTREQRRSGRKRDVRARTISVSRMTKRELQLGLVCYPEDTRELRPRTRAECDDFGRPCPFVSCRYHLALDVSERTGAIKLLFPDLEPGELAASCSLDVADDGPHTLEQVGELLNITRERLRQIEVVALARLEQAGGAALREHAPDDVLVPGRESGRRRLPTLQLERT